MFGFLTFGTTLTFLDQAFKARIEKEEKGTFPRELAISKGKIKLYQNHNDCLLYTSPPHCHARGRRLTA